MHDITQKFNKISSDVITIETKFREAGHTSIAELIRRIQLKEKEKLELVSEQMKVKKKKISSPVLLPKISLQLIWFVLVSTFSSDFFTVNTFTPTSDQDRISPYSVNTISSRQVMRIEKNINHGIIS